MQSHADTNEEDHQFTEDQERMRRNLRYHFMNPKEKWQAKGTLPIKMILIIIKLIILTIQVIIFSENNSKEVTFVEGSKTTFKHMFLKNWESSFETLPYPPSSGPFAIYRINEFYSAASYALENYYKIKEEAIGPYGYGDNNEPLMKLCNTYYQISEINPSKATYNFSDAVTDCIELKPIQFQNKSGFSYDVQDFLKNKNFSINFNGLIKAELNFTLRSIQLKSYEIDRIPNCFQFDITILFDNNYHNGQVLIDLKVSLLELICCHNFTSSSGEDINDLLKAVDYLALIFSFVSFILCCRSIVRLYKFWKKVKIFYLYEMGMDISNKRRHFFSISYMLIFFGDILVICGTIIKLQMYSPEQKRAMNFSFCNYLLGIGVFLGYLTLLRYFTFYRKSSILINTIKAATAPLLRFSLCSIILYMAFSLLGWIILGPYHLKFRTFVSSVACLFSLMNGDDMYVTLSIISSDSPVIFVFSQLFIYLFCLLFIFVVLNLILTIIIEAYNDVQNQGMSTKQLDYFWGFINACQESCKSSLYRSDMIYDKSLRKQRSANFSRKFVDTFCCCIGKGNHTPEIKIHHTYEDDDTTEFLNKQIINRNDDDDDDERDDVKHLINRNRSPKENYGSMCHTHNQSTTYREASNQSFDNHDHPLSC